MEHPENGGTRHWRAHLDLLATVAFIAACGTVIGTTLLGRPNAGPLARQVAANQAEPPLPTEDLALQGAAAEGNAAATVAILEYSDFQCPFCGRFARDVLPALRDRYVRSGKVLFAFRHLTLANHAFSEKAAVAAECGGAQGRFWDLHDQLFTHQDQLDAPHFRRYAAGLQLDMARFDACLSSDMQQRVRDDTEGGRKLAIRGTPTFFVGTLKPHLKLSVAKRLTGARPSSDFIAVLDELIKTDGRTAAK